MDIKEHIKGEARFLYYRDGSLWYITNSDLLFPVPVSDIGNATFKATDRAILFMRYIRKWLQEIENGAE